MKKKGITFWEQNIEYLVLGVAVLFCLGFGGWQLLRSPNEMDGVKPSDVNDKLTAAEESLNLKLNGEPIDLPDHESVAPQFTAMLDESVAPAAMLAAIAPGHQFQGATIGGEGGGLFPALEIPAPRQIQVVTDYDGLDPAVVNDNETLQQRFPSAPYDVYWTTIAATFDLAAMRAEYRQAATAELNAIPESWYDGREEIVRVRVERQQRLGSGWGDTVEIDALPGSFSLASQIADGSQDARDNIMAILEDPLARRAVIQPEFLATLNNSWSTPRPPVDEMSREDLDMLEPDELEILDLRRRRTEALTERAEQLALLLEAGGIDPKEEDAREEERQQSEREQREEERRRQREERDRQRGGPPGGGGGLSGRGSGDDRNTGGGRRGAPGSGMFGGGGDDGERSERELERRRNRLAGKIRSLDKSIDRIERRLTGLGFDFNAVADEVEVVVDPFDSDEVMIWAFDIDVESGATYRYRLVVDCINPFFRKKLYLDESQHDRADSMVVASVASEWSEPAEILPPTSFFVTAAYPEKGDLGMGQIDAEVYRFHDGRWWKETFRPEPGELIGGEKEPRRGGDGRVIDFNTGWYVVDILNRIDAGEGDAAIGRAGEAIVQRIDDPNQVREANPVRSLASVSRQELDEFVRDAEAAAQERALEGE